MAKEGLGCAGNSLSPDNMLSLDGPSRLLSYLCFSSAAFALETKVFEHPLICLLTSSPALRASACHDDLSDPNPENSVLKIPRCAKQTPEHLTYSFLGVLYTFKFRVWSFA